MRNAEQMDSGVKMVMTFRLNEERFLVEDYSPDSRKFEEFFRKIKVVRNGDPDGRGSLMNYNQIALILRLGDGVLLNVNGENKDFQRIVFRTDEKNADDYSSYGGSVYAFNTLTTFFDSVEFFSEGDPDGNGDLAANDEVAIRVVLRDGTDFSLLNNPDRR